MGFGDEEALERSRGELRRNMMRSIIAEPLLSKSVSFG